MNETGIIWTELTWNPVSGCDEVTAGCAYCYAKTLAENRRGTPAFPNGFELTLRPHKLAEPARIKEPSLIFVNSMSDFFWEKIDDDYRDRMVDVIEGTPRHQYQVLTKRPENLLRYSRRRRLPPNFWAGVTIENQKNMDRWGVLRQVEAEVRFVSAEPLLGPLDFGDMGGLHWVITGGESGVHMAAAKMQQMRGLAIRDGGKWVPHPERIAWVRSIRDQCIRQGVALFHKQWGGLYPKSAGRDLDGVTWDQFPRYPEGKTSISNEFLNKPDSRA